MRAVNLIPTDERGGSSIPVGRSGGAAYVVLGVLGVLAAFALLYGLADHQISSDAPRSRRSPPGLSRRRRARLSCRPTRASSRCANSASRPSPSSWTRALTGPMPSTNSVACCRPDVSLTSLSGTVGSTSGAASSAGAATASSGGTATASSSVASATPPGSIPTFTLAGCATSQAEVALTLDRLRLIDGVNEVTLQSSTKTGASGGGGGGGCTGSQAAFSVQVTFDALPGLSAGASGSTTTTTVSASTSGAAPSTGAAR